MTPDPQNAMHMNSHVLLHREKSSRGVMGSSFLHCLEWYSKLEAVFNYLHLLPFISPRLFLRSWAPASFSGYSAMALIQCPSAAVLLSSDIMYRQYFANFINNSRPYSFQPDSQWFFCSLLNISLILIVCAWYLGAQ